MIGYIELLDKKKPYAIIQYWYDDTSRIEGSFIGIFKDEEDLERFLINEYKQQKETGFYFIYIYQR